jgi:hypothetical protein
VASAPHLQSVICSADHAYGGPAVRGLPDREETKCNQAGRGDPEHGGAIGIMLDSSGKNVVV